MNTASIIIQIYEIQTPSEAEKLIEIGVDHVGSVVVSAVSWKIPQIRQTIELTANTQSQSSLILLFSNPDSVFRALDYYQPDIVHFCESLTYNNGARKGCMELLQLQKNVRVRFPDIKIMRSIPIPQPGLTSRIPIISLARMFEPTSDYFLTDTLLIEPGDAATACQPVSGFIGITGQTCDWNAAGRLAKTSSIPVILGGGISPDNVFDGIQQVHPAGIDSCTGTNALDAKGRPIRFKKDFHKVKQLVEMVRQAEQALVQ